MNDLSALLEQAAPAAAKPRLSGKEHAQRVADDYDTPEFYIECAREALGGEIACDPASSDHANEIVQALFYYTHEHSGLSVNAKWRSPVFLNPPSSRRDEFLKRAQLEIKNRDCEMVVCLNTKHVCAGYTMDTILPFVTAMHIPRGRPAFLHSDNHERSESPTDGRAFLYVGPNPHRFIKAFSRGVGWTCLTTSYQSDLRRGK